MTIVFDVSSIHRRRAGIGRFSLLLLKGIASANLPHEFVLHGWSRELDIEMLQSFAGSNLRLSLARVPGFLKRFYWNLLRTPKLERFVGSYDVFHSMEPLLPPVGQHKSIITFHDLAYRRFPSFFRKSETVKWDILFRRAAMKADVVIAPSDFTREELATVLSVPADRIRVLRPPVEPIFLEQSSHEDGEIEAPKKFSGLGQFILFVGTVEPRKNLVRLIRAYQQFASLVSDPPALVIAGKLGWMYENVLEAIRTSQHRNRIVLLNYVSDEELRQLYRSALFFVFPSLYEGHGFPVVEAMASRLPVIASNSSSLAEIGAGAAYLVDPENEQELAEGMHQLFSNESLRRELGQKGFERARAFTLEKAVHSLASIYDSMRG